MENIEEKKIVLRESLFEELKLGLIEIKQLSKEENVKVKAEKLLKLINRENTLLNESIEEIIYNKMKTTQDEELNVKLYMLYRKLQDGKTSEDEALTQYEMLCDQEYFKGYVY